MVKISQKKINEIIQSIKNNKAPIKLQNLNKVKYGEGEYANDIVISNNTPAIKNARLIEKYLSSTSKKTKGLSLIDFKNLQTNKKLQNSI